MVNLFKIHNNNTNSTFTLFNEKYGRSLVDYCAILSKFQIHVLSLEEYLSQSQNLPVIDDVENNAFACYIQKFEDDIRSTEAGIIYNTKVINELELTDLEKEACIAHEVGHILYFFLENKSFYPGPNGEEIYADSIPVRLGIKSEMLSTIIKLHNNNRYKENVNAFNIRKLFIENIS